MIQRYQGYVIAVFVGEEFKSPTLVMYEDHLAEIEKKDFIIADLEKKLNSCKLPLKPIIQGIKE